MSLGLFVSSAQPLLLFLSHPWKHNETHFSILVLIANRHVTALLASLASLSAI